MSESDEVARTARLKIERAKHHVNDLNRKIAAYLVKEPFKLVFARMKNSNRATPILKSQIAIPPEFSLIIGDAVHNLRSALDHVIWKMVGHLASRPDNVQYPFPTKAVGENGFRSTITGREVQRAGENVVKAITALNAQPGGDKLIYGVHALDIADKHKLIVTMAESATLERRFCVPANPGLSVNWIGAAWVRTASDEPPDGWLEEQAKVQPTFFVAFGDSEPFVGEEAVTVLRNMTDRISEAVDRLVAAYHSPAIASLSSDLG